MTKKQYISVLCLSFLSVSLSTFAIGMKVSSYIYKPHVAALEKKVSQLEEREPIIIYQVDNAGGMMFGKIKEKQIIEGRYTVTVGAYGKFLVTKEQFDSLNIGDEAPDYLKQRGIESNQVPGENNE